MKIKRNLLDDSLITDGNLNIIMEDGRPNPDIWAIGDAAQVDGTPLPATAQGDPLVLLIAS